MRGVAEVDLQNLSDVHTRRHAQRVQNDIQRRTIRQERHILLRQNAGDNTLVAVTARHLIANGNFPLLRDVNADDLIDAGSELVAVFSREDLHVDNDAGLAVRDLQRRIADFSCLLAEDGAKQPLFCGELGFALRRDLTDQIVARGDLRADADDAVFVEILEGILADVRNVSCNFLRSELGVPGLGFVFFNVDGGEHILAHEAFVQQNRVLVVVAFPRHEADEHVLAERDLTLRAGGAVCDDLTGFHTLASRDNRALVDAGALV